MPASFAPLSPTWAQRAPRLGEKYDDDYLDNRFPYYPVDFDWRYAYSPYHNIIPGIRYPSVLLTAGENDSRVHPMHARKMAARLQAAARNDFDEDPILLWVERAAGHGAGKPLRLRIQETADVWSFLMWQTGMVEESD